MSRHQTNVSIAYAVLATAGGFHRDPEDDDVLTAGVLAHAPGDGAIPIAREIAGALRMEVVEIGCEGIELHPGAINLVAHGRIEPAVALGRPVLILLTGAHGADPGVIEALCSATRRRVEDRPVTLIAITTTAAERMVAEKMARGLGWDVGQVAMHRTDAENRRIVERIAAAIAD